MKTSLDVNASSGSPYKIMFYLGLLFVALGVLIGGGGLVAAVATREPGALFFGVMFLAIMGGVGGFFAKLGHDGLAGDKETLEQGAAYLGKIYDYEPDPSVTMNGAPCIILVVRYLMAGQVAEARVATGSSNIALFPRGATVSIKVHNGRAALVPGSVSNLAIEQENDLMNPDFDPSGMMRSINVGCPNCGANVAVPVGMSRFCPYCNTKLSLDDAGHVVMGR